MRLPSAMFVLLLISIIVGLFVLGIMFPTHHDVRFLR
jgi:hypothetical protein